MMKYKLLNISLFLVISVLLSCSPKVQLSKLNVAKYYQTNYNFANANVKFYHEDTNTIDLNIQFANNKIKYELDDIGQTYLANYTVKLNLLKDIDSKELLYQQEWVFEDSINFLRDILINYKLDVNYKIDDVVYAIISFTDNNVKRRYRHTEFVYPTEKYSKNDFLVLDDAQDIYYGLNLNPYKNYTINSNNDFLDSIKITYYQDNYKIAKPPFINKESSKQTILDSVFYIHKNDDDLFSYFINKSDGVFVLGDINEGSLKLNSMGQYFPAMNNYDEMIASLRYITSNKEYKKLLSNEDKKSAIDKFWLEISNDNDQLAENLISKYYKNIEISNKYFTTYKAGWKTDRGMIYVVFGKPDYVYNTESSEEWWYGDPNDYRSTHFIFNKRIIGNCFEDYILIKNIKYKQLWYINVEKWRR